MTVDGELLTRPLTEAALAGGQLDIPYMIGYNKNDMSPEAMKKAAVNWSLLLENKGVRRLMCMLSPGNFRPIRTN